MHRRTKTGQTGKTPPATKNNMGSQQGSSPFFSYSGAFLNDGLGQVVRMNDSCGGAGAYLPERDMEKYSLNPKTKREVRQNVKNMSREKMPPSRYILKLTYLFCGLILCALCG